MQRIQMIKSVAGLAATLLAAWLFFGAVFQYDNKYTARIPPAQEGRIILHAQSLEEPVYLVDGWELWPGILLAPDQLDDAPITPLYTFMGEHLNLSHFKTDHSPYGASTWRLRIQYEGSPKPCVLYLSEIYSSFILYVNGERVASQGSTQPYRPRIQDTGVSITLQADTEIVLQTVNYSHYYSGPTYPPILGSAQTVLSFSGSRLMFYGFLCFGTLSAALFSVAIWFGSLRKPRRDPVTLLFGALSLGFSVYVSYPFSRFLGITIVCPLYALEDASFMLIVWCALRISLWLCALSHTRFGFYSSRIAFSMMLICVIVPCFLLPILPAFGVLYGQFITVYRLLSALLLMGLAVYGCLRNKAGGLWLLWGSGFYGCGLLAGALTVYSFEPAQWGWMEEYGVFAMVLCFGVLMVQRSYTLLAENGRLTEHLQEEVAEKTKALRLMICEREELMSTFLHDMKSPAAFMLSYMQSVRRNNVGLDDTMHEQLSILEKKCTDIRDHVQMAQRYTVENPLITPHTRLDLRAFLKEFYIFNKPDVEMDGQNLTLHMLDQPCFVQADPDKLRQMLQNLVYNALSFTPPDGTIHLALERDDTCAFLTVRDTGCGIDPENLNKIFDRSFTTHRGDGGTGLGLYIVRTIALEHGGEVTVQSKAGHGAAFTVRLPMT